MRRVLVLAAFAALSVGCDTVHDRPATWSYIHAAIVVPSCATASCHSRISSVAGMDMSTRHAAYTAFTQTTCGAPEIPGEPPLAQARERVMHALWGIGTRTGSEVADLLMPPDQPLSEVDIDLIERWYDAGAPCD